MPFLLRSIGDFIPVKMEFITVKFWPYGQPISRPDVHLIGKRKVEFVKRCKVWKLKGDVGCNTKYLQGVSAC